ncbi:hypothetical protein F4779DRAFT_614331 [Xylariaceae sp. FL0662B]|nr:hypothetical protein F4779DRAFT_614331 [Xylariaceae sp. FL0662B]
MASLNLPSNQRRELVDGVRRVTSEILKRRVKELDPTISEQIGVAVLVLGHKYGSVNQSNNKGYRGEVLAQVVYIVLETVIDYASLESPEILITLSELLVVSDLMDRLRKSMKDFLSFPTALFDQQLQRVVSDSVKRRYGSTDSQTIFNIICDRIRNGESKSIRKHHALYDFFEKCAYGSPNRGGLYSTAERKLVCALENTQHLLEQDIRYATPFFLRGATLILGDGADQATMCIWGTDMVEIPALSRDEKSPRAHFRGERTAFNLQR